MRKVTKEVADYEAKLEANFRSYPSDALHYYRLTSGDVFAIPSRHQVFWREPERFARSLEPAERVPVQDGIGFGFFLPDFTGYTLENFKDEFSRSRVDVLINRVDPKTYEKNPAVYWEPKETIRRRTIPEPSILDMANPERKWGMTCYRTMLDRRLEVFCVGKRSNGQEVLWEVYDHPDVYKWIPNPGARTRYFTRELFGGAQVTIRMHHSHIGRWREIDDFVRRSVRQWRVEPKTTSNK